MTRMLRFSNRAAQLQYHLLMGLFRLAVTRGLYGRFARGLGRIFDSNNAVFISGGEGDASYKIYLNDGYWTRFVLFHNEYEPEVGHIIQAAKGATPLFCDLGANKGYWTTKASPCFDRVIAVEASADTYRHLFENAGELPNVTLHRAAIHCRTGEVLSFINTHHSHASARLGDQVNPGDTVEEVTTQRIDDLVPPGTPALIKLDVEGAEIAAFQGAGRALSDGSVLIYEDHGADRDSPPTAHLLKIPDIRVYFCETTLIPITNTDQLAHLKTDYFKGYNLLAAHKDSLLLAKIHDAFANF